MSSSYVAADSLGRAVEDSSFLSKVEDKNPYNYSCNDIMEDIFSAKVADFRQVFRTDQNAHMI